MIITIDGPAGSGKSTAARNLAKALGLAYLDTGATYRAVTLKALREDIDLEDESQVVHIARQADVQLRVDPDSLALTVLLDGRDVTEDIRTQRVTDNAHYIARCAAAREVLVDLQRQIGRQLGHFVTEGRDQGSVVFPDADVKFFLEADPRERARRRTAELQQAGEAVTQEQVLESILQRDERDRRRAASPLVKPDGAIEIDTSNLSPENTVRTLASHVEQTS